MKYPSKIVQIALDDLSKNINMTSGITNPFDNNRAKTYIRALHKFEPVLNSDEVSNYLVRELHWTDNQTKEVIILIDKLNSGSSFQGGETNDLQNYYKQWEKEVNGNDKSNSCK